MEVFNCIKSRRSVRSYTDQIVEQVVIEKLLQSAIYAPSGKNGQPWKFKVITDKDLINEISDLSVYGKWMRSAPCFFFVYLDKEKSYDYIKDVQSCGAAIQNILLCANSLSVDSCWVGEVLNKATEVSKLAGIDTSKFELMAVITVGYKSGRTLNPGRNSIESFLLER